jgi:hypothetical protein
MVAIERMATEEQLDAASIGLKKRAQDLILNLAVPGRATQVTDAFGIVHFQTATHKNVDGWLVNMALDLSRVSVGGDGRKRTIVTVEYSSEDTAILCRPEDRPQHDMNLVVVYGQYVPHSYGLPKELVSHAEYITFSLRQNKHDRQSPVEDRITVFFDYAGVVSKAVRHAFTTPEQELWRAIKELEKGDQSVQRKYGIEPANPMTIFQASGLLDLALQQTRHPAYQKEQEVIPKSATRVSGSGFKYCDKPKLLM